jgi:hypothetical protein
MSCGSPKSRTAILPSASCIGDVLRAVGCREILLDRLRAVFGLDLAGKAGRKVGVACLANTIMPSAATS